MRGVRDGEIEGRVQDIVMRYKYKVRELTDDVKHVTRESTKQILNNHQYSDIDTVSNVGEEKEMEAMSFKKLKAKLDHKKEYLVMYTNKHGNYISTIVRGKEPK